MILSRTIYDSQGHSGNTYYARFVRKADGKIWDGTNEVMATNPNWEDQAVTLPEVGTNGQFKVYFPTNLPKGQFDVIIHQQAGSAPANTDDIELQYDDTCGSSDFGF